MVVEHTVHCVPASIDERAVRRELRRQIARLEGQLADARVSAFPHDPGVAAAATAPAPPGGPRVLGLGELEWVRDTLVVRVATARAQLRARDERRTAARGLLERMLVEPERHRFVRVASRDLGDGGCGVWHVRPRLGLLGMLMGWWQVKLSSGCPLAC